jgi:protein PhnA
VGVLGKDLTRRSRGRCELCGSQDGPRLYELPPFPEEPDPARTLMACTRCRDWLEHDRFEPIEAHFLSSAVWSEEPAVRLAAGRMLLRADFDDDPWLLDALEAAGIDPASGELRAAVVG